MQHCTASIQLEEFMLVDIGQHSHQLLVHISRIYRIISIASKGNTIKFGELTVRTARAGGCLINSVRGIFAGGYKQPSPGYLLDYMTIASQEMEQFWRFINWKTREMLVD